MTAALQIGRGAARGPQLPGGRRIWASRSRSQGPMICFSQDAHHPLSSRTGSLAVLSWKRRRVDESSPPGQSLISHQSSAIRSSSNHLQQRPKSILASLRSFQNQQPNNGTSLRLASTQPPSSSPSEPPPPQKPPTLVDKLKSVTATPHENIYTIPNILTFSRLLSAPAIGYFVFTSQPLPALCLFFYAGVTDLLDGYLARRLNQHTVVGTVIDPMADKTLMTITVAALGLTGQFPWWLVLIILGRDVALAISAIWWRWISLPPPKTMRRYWDFSLPSAEVYPTEISKINTLLQLLLIGDALVLPVLPTAMAEGWNLLGVLEGWEVLVAATTVWSGLSYVGNKDAVKIIGREEREARERAARGETEKVVKRE